jgi:dTDP-4-dehydrorhamnose reductase
MAVRVIVTGAAGQLGRQLVRAFAGAGHDVVGLGRSELDLSQPDSGDLIASLRPDIVINAAAWTDVDGCARDPQRAMLLNGEAPGRLAAGGARSGALFVQISTNEVFDGAADRPYAEGDTANPINPYGASKLAGEKSVAEAAPRHLIVRTAWLFGPGGSNFVTKILAAADRAAQRGEALTVVADECGNPTWTPALADAIAGLATSNQSDGIVHLAGQPATSRLEWARVAIEVARPGITVEPITRAAFPRPSNAPARALLRPTDGLAELTWVEETRTYARSLGSPISSQAAST